MYKIKIGLFVVLVSSKNDLKMTNKSEEIYLYVSYEVRNEVDSWNEVSKRQKQIIADRFKFAHHKL